MEYDKQSRDVQGIKREYFKKQPTDFDELRALDTKVKRPVKTIAYVFGAIATLVFGIGLCLAMNVIDPGVYYGVYISSNTIGSGIGVGLVGVFMLTINYPIYKRILLLRKRKYADKILSLTEKILNKQY